MKKGDKGAFDALILQAKLGSTKELTRRFLFLFFLFYTFEHVGTRVVVRLNKRVEHRVPVDARGDSSRDDEGFLQAVDMPAKHLPDAVVSEHRRGTDSRVYKKRGDSTDVQIRYARVGCATIPDNHLLFLFPLTPFTFF